MVEYLITSLLILGLCLVADLFLKTNVLKRWKPFFVMYFIGVILGVPWDNIAIWRGHWWFGKEYLLGIKIGLMPVEELIILADFLLICVISWEYFRKKK